MTEKELRKLNRMQLLELLIMQTEEIEKLQKQVELLQEKRTQETLHIEQMGSIAEAALKISGLLTASQTAADIYLNAARAKARDIIKEAHEAAEAITNGEE